MRSMAIDRRRFMAAGVLGLAGASGFARVVAAGPSAVRPVYLAAREAGGRYEVAVFGPDGQVQQVIPLPDRGHGFALDGTGSKAVVFGRQPGYYAAVFDIRAGSGMAAVNVEPEWVEPAAGRHFFGHGIFADNGRLLVATENDYENARGVIGIYRQGSTDKGWRRVAELDCGGIGPHEMILMPDGRTACVANGGLLTHPDYGKLVLNRATMTPSLAYIDLFTGQLLEQVFLPDSLQQLSVRHLALDAEGKVWFGGQYEGSSTYRPPLVGFHRRGEPLAFASTPDNACWYGMSNYVGSVAADATGEYLATTSPVGGVVMIWNTATGRWVRTVPLPDVCGVAPAPAGGFLVSSGQGDLWHVDQRLSVLVKAPAAWDNHMRQLW